MFVPFCAFFVFDSITEGVVYLVPGTSYKALLSASGPRRPLRSLRKEKYINLLLEADGGSMIEYSFF